MNKWMAFLLITVLFAGIFSLPADTSACSCEQPPGVEEELSRSDAVFSGKAIAVDEKPAVFLAATRSVVFQVAHVWKGPEQSQIKLKTGQGDGDCGFEFNVGQEYLVYAAKSDMYGTNGLTTIVCDRTAVLSQAQGDFAVLGEGVQPTEEVDLLSQNNWQYAVGIFIVLAIIAFIVYRKRKKIS